jgi:hypothetical protein
MREYHVDMHKTLCDYVSHGNKKNGVFLFDQSSGHTKMQSDSLHMRDMNVSHGGSAEIMHATIIHEVRPHPRILHVGDNQEMHFVEGNNGPFG